MDPNAHMNRNRKRQGKDQGRSSLRSGQPRSRASGVLVVQTYATISRSLERYSIIVGNDLPIRARRRCAIG